MSVALNNLASSTHRCSFSGGSMWVNLTASVSSLSIVPVYSQISVLNSGALPFAAGTLATSLYAFVQNTGNGTGRFTLVPTGCSGAGNPLVTAGSITQTLLPGATTQFIFPVGGRVLLASPCPCILINNVRHLDEILHRQMACE